MTHPDSTMPTEQNAATSAAARGYAGHSIHGITLKDIRDAVIKMPKLTTIEYVRVSNAWWVCLEDGKPISSSPHNDLMKAIEEASRHNEKVSDRPRWQATTETAAHRAGSLHRML